MRRSTISDDPRLDRLPAIEDLMKLAKKRMPHFAWEYFDSGTGRESTFRANESEFEKIRLLPEFVKGELIPNTGTNIFGQACSTPIGIAPIGMTSLMWPGAEAALAAMANKKAVPYCLSTVAADSVENIGPLAGEHGWFQLYPPKLPEVRTDLLKRARNSGFKVLVITVDIPTPSMRERHRRAQVSIPPRMTPKILLDIAMRPAWALATFKRGEPRFLNLEPYAGSSDLKQVSTFIAQTLGQQMDWDYILAARDSWNGPVVIKGILHPDDAAKAVAEGIDGIWVSNHGGRQFDAAPAAIDALPAIKKRIGNDATIIFDSGIRSGLDVLRAIHLGADFVFAGRPFVAGVAALGTSKADHALNILNAELSNVMTQLGITKISEIPNVSRA